MLDRTGVTAPNGDDLTLRAQPNANGPLLYVTGYLTDLLVPNTPRVSIDMNGGLLDVGDLSLLGAVQIAVDAGAVSPTSFLLQTPTTGLTAPLVIEASPINSQPAPGLSILEGDDGQAPAPA